MKRILIILGIALGIIILSPLLLLLALILLIPVRYKLRLENSGNFTFNIKISYLFGIIRRSYGYNSTESEPEEESGPATEPTSKKSTQAFKKTKPLKKENKASKSSDATKNKLPLTVKRIKTIIRLGLTAIKKYIRILAPRRLAVTGLFSLGCPANTAFAQGALEIIAAFLRRRNRRRRPYKRYDIDLAGDYLAEEAHFTGTLSAAGSIVPLSLLGPALWLVSKKEIRAEIKNFL